tara:strand:- start:559 stop:852 length:294 start_codon:yes stop_codon:yes gene_type:complete
MRIKLDYYQVMDAIETYVKDNLKSEVCFDDRYTEFHAETMNPVREKKKHKNGKVIKNEHGYEQWEIVGYENNNVHFDENSDFEIFIEPKLFNEEEAS